MKKFKPTLVKFYGENGNIYRGDNIPILQAIATLKREGYKKFYQGLDSLDCQITIVGINNRNKVRLKQRQESGLLNAVEVEL